MDVLIMSGIEIGDGAIIASGSVVTKDIEPYAIVGGNPARHIRWRFPEEIRGRLLELKWWQYNLEDFSDLDLGDVESFLTHMERRKASLDPWVPECPKFIDELRKVCPVPWSEDEYRAEFFSALNVRDLNSAKSIAENWKVEFSTSWRPYDALGHLYTKCGEHAVALEFAQRALEMAGRSWGHVARVANIYIDLGNLQLAEVLFCEAISLPGGAPVEKWLAQLRGRIALK